MSNTGFTRVFDGSHLRADLFGADDANAPCDRLIVTFDFRQDDKSDFSPSRPVERFTTQKWANLQIKSRRNDWFINADTLALDAALASLGHRFNTVHALGYSLGAYGALRFSKALDIDHAVVVSPQFSIDAQTVPFETRYTPEAQGFDPAIGDLKAHAKPDLSGLMIYDPFITLDRMHARDIQSTFPQLGALRLCFGGHPATRCLRHDQSAWRVQRAVIDADTAVQSIMRAHNKGRMGDPRYWRRLAKQADPRHPVLAQQARDVEAELILIKRKGIRP
jgi:hypothetical protein